MSGWLRASHKDFGFPLSLGRKQPVSVTFSIPLKSSLADAAQDTKVCSHGPDSGQTCLPRPPPRPGPAPRKLQPGVSKGLQPRASHQLGLPARTPDWEGLRRPFPGENAPSNQLSRGH